MDPHRFDTLARVLGRRGSRRAAVRGGAVGLSAVALGALSVHHAVAQDATPAPAVVSDDPSLLFVQVFGGGLLAPKTGEDGVFTLTLSQGSGSTLYFSDRPDRLVGTWSTADFLDRLAFPDDNPPNAAIVATGANGDDVLIVELFNPVYDKAGGTLTYDVHFLGQADVDMTFSEVPLVAPTDETTFGASHLFIDSDAFCGTHDMFCYVNGTDAEVGQIGQAGFRITYGSDLGDWYCIPDSGCAQYAERCNETYADCNGNCFAAAPYFVRRYGMHDRTSCG